MFEIQKYNFLKNLQALDYIEDIFLYGSRARYEASPRADIDIAINCPKANIHEWNQVLDIVDNADTLLKIDCVRFDDLSNSSELKKNINKEKIVLFSRNET